MRELGVKIIKHLFFLQMIFVGRDSYAQFYVSPKVCVNEANMPVTGVPPTGGSMGGAAGAVQNCESFTSFFDTDTNSVSSIWDFGDGFGFANGRSVTYGYVSAGDYTVTVTKTMKNSSVNIASKNITVGSYPQQPQFNGKTETDTTVCENTTLKLDPFKGLNPSGVKYLWFPGGETTPSIDVDTAGCYSVEVSDAVSGCSKSATIKVKFCFEPPASRGGSEVWYFGDGAKLDFDLSGTSVIPDSLENEGTLNPEPDLTDIRFSPSPSSGRSQVNSDGAVAMVYDIGGGIAFYSDGKKIFSGLNDQEIPRADGTPFSMAIPASSQGLVIVPKPNCNTCNYTQYQIYYVNTDTKTLSYSVIDMRFNNGRGAVVEENVPVLFPVSEKMIGLRAPDDSSYYIINSNITEGTFHVLNISSAGVTVNNALGLTSSSEKASSGGYLSVSPNRRFLAQGVVIGGQNFVEVYTVDPQNLAISSPMLIDLGISSPPSVYGLAFSSLGDILYVTLRGDGTANAPSYLIQLDLTLGNPALISAQKNIISQNNTLVYGALQMGPVLQEGSKYLYLAVENQKYIAYIQNPGILGDANVVGFSIRPGSAEVGVQTDGTTKLGFPNIVGAAREDEGDGISAQYSGNCEQSPTILTTQGICSPMKNEVKWFFPDGSTQTGLQVSYVFPDTGWNNVRAEFTVINESKITEFVNNQIVERIVRTECTKEIYNGRIYIKPAPRLTIPEPIYLCIDAGEKKLIDPKPKGGLSFDFRWMTSKDVTLSTAPSYTFDLANSDGTPLIYKIEVINNYDCKVKQDITVLPGCDPIIIIPEVFSPNGDSINDTFIVRAENVIDYDLRIYNRWGELVFQSLNSDIHWDGRVKGKMFANQIYPYTLTYKGKYDKQGKIISQKGSVIVVK